MAGWVRDEPCPGLALWWSRALHHFLGTSFFPSSFLLPLLPLLIGGRSSSGCAFLKIKVERSKCWEMDGEGWSEQRPSPALARLRWVWPSTLHS